MDFNFGNHDHIGEAADENRRELEAAMDAKLADEAADRRTANKRFWLMLAVTAIGALAAIVAAVASVVALMD